MITIKEIYSENLSRWISKYLGESRHFSNTVALRADDHSPWLTNRGAYHVGVLWLVDNCPANVCGEIVRQFMAEELGVKHV